MFIISQRSKLSVDHYKSSPVEYMDWQDFFGNFFVVGTTQLLKTNLKIPFPFTGTNFAQGSMHEYINIYIYIYIYICIDGIGVRSY